MNAFNDCYYHCACYNEFFFFFLKYTIHEHRRVDRSQTRQYSKNVRDLRVLSDIIRDATPRGKTTGVVEWQTDTRRLIRILPRLYRTDENRANNMYRIILFGAVYLIIMVLYSR